jgi:hypothetical protein
MPLRPNLVPFSFLKSVAERLARDIDALFLFGVYVVGTSALMARVPSFPVIALAALVCVTFVLRRTMAEWTRLRAAEQRVRGEEARIRAIKGGYRNQQTRELLLPLGKGNKDRLSGNLEGSGDDRTGG